MHNVSKWLDTLQKSCSICCKVFKVCLTILGRYAINFGKKLCFEAPAQTSSYVLDWTSGTLVYTIWYTQGTVNILQGAITKMQATIFL